MYAHAFVRKSLNINCATRQTNKRPIWFLKINYNRSSLLTSHYSLLVDKLLVLSLTKIKRTLNKQTPGCTGVKTVCS